MWCTFNTDKRVHVQGVVLKYEIHACAWFHPELQAAAGTTADDLLHV